MAHLESRRKIHLADLLADRLGNFPSTVAGIAAPEPGGAIQHLTAFDVGIEHPFRAFQQSRTVLELPVGGKGHPEFVKTDVLLSVGRLLHAVHVGRPGVAETWG